MSGLPSWKANALPQASASVQATALRVVQVMTFLLRRSAMLCRFGAHRKMPACPVAVASPLSHGDPILADSHGYGRFGSGHAVRRIEDPALVTGRGAFVDDFDLDGQAQLCFLRSLHAHARIVSIDTSAAMAIPGVVAVLTGDDLVRAGVGVFPGPAGFKRSEEHTSELQ